MSYDILFDPAEEAEPRPLDQRAWEQIVTGARAIFGDDITRMQPMAATNWLMGRPPFSSPAPTIRQ